MTLRKRDFTSPNGSTLFWRKLAVRSLPKKLVGLADGDVQVGAQGSRPGNRYEAVRPAPDRPTETLLCPHLLHFEWKE